MDSLKRFADNDDRSIKKARIDDAEDDNAIAETDPYQKICKLISTDIPTAGGENTGAVPKWGPRQIRAMNAFDFGVIQFDNKWGAEECLRILNNLTNLILINRIEIASDRTISFCEEYEEDDVVNRYENILPPRQNLVSYETAGITGEPKTKRVHANELTYTNNETGEKIKTGYYRSQAPTAASAGDVYSSLLRAESKNPCIFNLVEKREQAKTQRWAEDTNEEIREKNRILDKLNRKIKGLNEENIKLDVLNNDIREINKQIHEEGFGEDLLIKEQEEGKMHKIDALPKRDFVMKKFDPYYPETQNATVKFEGKIPIVVTNIKTTHEGKIDIYELNVKKEYTQELIQKKLEYEEGMDEDDYDEDDYPFASDAEAIFKNLEQPVLEKALTVKNYTGWKDMEGITVKDLDNLAKEVVKTKNQEKSDHIVIHCSAGKGRTGTLVTAAIIREALEKGENNDLGINPDNYKSVICNLILDLREGGGGQGFVQSTQQLNLLFQYTEEMINNRKAYFPS